MRDERADADGSRDSGDLQRREDQGHRLVDHEAEQDKDRGHEQGDLEAGAERHGQRELHLVLGGELDGDEVLSEVADRRDDDDADEEGRQPERRDERLDDADEDLRQDREQGGGGHEDEDRDLRRPGGTGVALGLAMAAERLGRVRELVRPGTGRSR